MKMAPISLAIRRSAEVNVQRVSRGAGDDQLRLVRASLILHRFVIQFLLGIETVAHDLEPLAGHVQRHAVGQVAAFGQVHAHDGIAGFEEGEEDGLVGGGAAVGLDVGSLGTE
jgi:hypothetical protein